MREGIGSAFVYSIVIFMVGIIILLLVGSIGYSKAFKVNNRIIDIIEANDGYNTVAEQEVSQALSSIGYRVSATRIECPELDDSYGSYTKITPTLNYDYCVYKHTDNVRGDYYTVLTYMYFDFPVIGDHLKLKVLNQTKTINLIGGD